MATSISVNKCKVNGQSNSRHELCGDFFHRQYIPSALTSSRTRICHMADVSLPRSLSPRTMRRSFPAFETDHGISDKPYKRISTPFSAVDAAPDNGSPCLCLGTSDGQENRVRFKSRHRRTYSKHETKCKVGPFQRPQRVCQDPSLVANWDRKQLEQRLPTKDQS